MKVSLIKPNKLGTILKKYKLILLDCDGVIWIEDNIFPSTYPLIKFLSTNNIFYKFLTNNNTHSKDHLRKKFFKDERFSKDDHLINQNSILSSASITALNIKNKNVSKIFVIGTDDFCKEIEKTANCKVISANKFNQNKDLKRKELDEQCIPDDDIDSVVVGYDENINLFKIAYANRILNKKGTKFFGTNIDKNFVGKHGKLPGSYSFINMVQTASERTADIISKPDPLSLELILNDFNQNNDKGLNNIKKEDILMIGDNLSTDIKFANNCKIDSLFVLTGTTSLNKFYQIMDSKNVSCDFNKNIELLDYTNLKIHNQEIEIKDYNQYGIPTYITSNLELDLNIKI